jgi:hypothetical protein
MTTYIVRKRSFIYPDAATALLFTAPPDDTPILEIFDRFEGEFSAKSNKLLDKTAPAPKGVVKQANAIAALAPLPITTEVGRTNFCWAATVSASAETADRNYLLSVSYYLSDKLTNFGIPTDLRYGPFRYSAEEWFPVVEKANAAGQPSIKHEDLFDPLWQVSVAALRTGQAMKDFKDGHDRFPTPVELFFYERLGEKALKLLALTPGETCAAAFAAAPPVVPPAGSYGAEIKDRPSGEVIKEVTKGLIDGFVASRPDVERLQPHRRFFSDEDYAPWLAVARLMTSKNVAVDPTKLAGTFMTFPPALGPADRRSAAFVAFCFIECGVAEAKANALVMNNGAGLPASWKGWSQPAEDPPRPGTVVVLEAEGGKESVGILAEMPAAGDDKYKVYLCSDTGAISVGIEAVLKAKINTLRWLDITGADAPAVAGDAKLGSLSKKHESGDGGPGTISPGNDAGGISYGTYQFSTASGSADKFVASLPLELKKRFDGTKAGTPAFGAVWTAIAQENPEKFGTLQHNYIKKNFYDDLANQVNAGAAFDVNTRSAALKNCFWSTAVQHGPTGGASIIKGQINALKGGATPLMPVKPFDKLALEMIYAERGRKKANGRLEHFDTPANSNQILASVSQRFVDELADALKMLANEHI